MPAILWVSWGRIWIILEESSNYQLSITERSLYRSHIALISSVVRPVYLSMVSGDKPSRFIWAAVVSACSRIFDSLARMGNYQIADPVRNEVIGCKEIVSWERVSFLPVLIAFLAGFNTFSHRF